MYILIASFMLLIMITKMSRNRTLSMLSSTNGLEAIKENIDILDIINIREIDYRKKIEIMKYLTDNNFSVKTTDCNVTAVNEKVLDIIKIDNNNDAYVILSEKASGKRFYVTYYLDKIDNKILDTNKDNAIIIGKKFDVNIHNYDFVDMCDGLYINHRMNHHVIGKNIETKSVDIKYHENDSSIIVNFVFGNRTFCENINYKFDACFGSIFRILL